MADVTVGPPPPVPPTVEQPTEEVEELGIQPLRFLGLIGVFVLMTVLGGWELLLVVSVVVVFIIIHELGHFLSARWSGMLATEFFIGFGPRILAFKRGETTYGVKALPFGAYVRIIGMNNLEEVDPVDEPRAYRNAPWYKRMITVGAGPATHFVMAALLAIVAFWQLGQPIDDRWEVSQVSPDSAASAAGIQEGDQILSIEGQSTTDFDDLSTVVRSVRGELVDMEVLRDGEILQLNTRIGERLTSIGSAGISGLYAGDRVVAVDGDTIANYDEFVEVVTPRIGEQLEVEVFYLGDLHTETVSVQSVSTSPDAVQGFLGVGPGDVHEPLSFGTATVEGVTFLGEGVKEFASGIGRLFSTTDGWRGLFGLPTTPSSGGNITVVDAPDQIRPLPTIDENRVLSIVGAVGIGEQIVSQGFVEVVIFFAILNISLGVINLAPLLPFDGGHMVVATYERIRSFGGRTYTADAAKLLPVTYAVVAFMLLVGGIAIVRDIVDPVQL